MVKSQLRRFLRRRSVSPILLPGISSGWAGSTVSAPNFSSRSLRRCSVSGADWLLIVRSATRLSSDASPSSSRADITAARARAMRFSSESCMTSHIWRISTVACRALCMADFLNSSPAMCAMSAPITLMKAIMAATGMTVTATPSPKSDALIDALIARQYKSKRNRRSSQNAPAALFWKRARKEALP